MLTENHLEFLRLKGGCTRLSKSIHVKMPHHVADQIQENKTRLYGVQKEL